MGIFNTGIFTAPRFSAFPHGHSNKVSMKSGQIKPISTVFLNTGDRYDGVDVSAIVRNAPMLAPTLDTYRLDIHTFAVRLRSIGHASRNPWVYEDFFNLNKNTDGSLFLPSVTLGQILAANGLRTGTLFESLGFPTFKADREKYLEWLRNNHSYLFDPVAVLVNDDINSRCSVGPASFPFYSFANGVKRLIIQDLDEVGYFGDSNLYYINGLPYFLKGSDVPAREKYGFRSSLIHFVSERFPSIFPDYSEDSEVARAVSDNPILGSVVSVSPASSPLPPALANIDGVNVLDKVYEVYKVDAVSVLKEFEDWLLEGFLGLRCYNDDVSDFNASYRSIYYSSPDGTPWREVSYDIDSVFEVLRSAAVNSYPDAPRVVAVADPDNLHTVYDCLVPAYWYEAYWKIISDWYINTAVDNPDTFFADHKAVYSTLVSVSTVGCRGLGKLNVLFHRLWANDYFTSSFSSPQAGQAVGIPINGTIVDLRNANSMQKLKERLLYAGSRFRDVMYAITGKRTSAAILEMSEVIGECSLTINVDSVLQSSQTNNGKPLADYGGTGLGYRSGSKRVNYYAEEPTVIMVVASIVPQASYFQGLPRKFMRSNVYDYAIPQLANVGEQEVYSGEIYIGSDTSNERRYNIFGYQRRNGDMMWTPNEVHGEFQTSLDFWHNSRIFGSKPSLSREFLSIDAEADNLNRIFAVKSDAVDHFYCRFDFGGQIIRSLPKHVHYDL